MQSKSVSNGIQVWMLMGHIGAGKTTFAEALAPRIGARILKTSLLITGRNRLERQAMGDKLDSSTGGGWIRSAVRELAPKANRPVIVDAVRHPGQIEKIREMWPHPQSILIGIRTSNMSQHIESRHLDLAQMRELLEALRHPLEQKLSLDHCDLVVDNTRFRLEDLWPLVTS